jgi:putative copper resistance protein D
VTALGLLVRWVHLSSGIVLVGTCLVLLVAGRPAWPTAERWDRRALGLARAALATSLLAGLAALAMQVVVLEARPGALLDPTALARVLGSTRFGLVWLTRHGLLLLLLPFLSRRIQDASGADRVARRAQGLILGSLALGSAAWAGHAAAVEPRPHLAAGIDAIHLIAVGAWIGGLPALAWLCAMTWRREGADARPYAVLAVRRFSALALAAVIAVAASGGWNTWNQLGSVAAVLGTPHGRLLLVKLALLVPLLGVAAVNRRLIPSLAGEGDTIGRPALRRLGLQALVEFGVALALLGVAAWMSTTPPGRHVSPTWPLTFRLSYAATADLPGVATRFAAGGALAVVGTVALALGLARRRWWLAAGVAPLAVIVGAAVALPPLAVDAYPTTYRRAGEPYHAVSISAGVGIFGRSCATCHSPDATDVLGPRTDRHTAGDLYWWITAGTPDGRMPGFGRVLSDEERWDLVNVLRARAAGRLAAQRLGPRVGPEHPGLVAPDFVFAVGPSPSHSLREYRGRRIVVLVLFTLPASRPRLAQLAQAYETIVGFGAEVVAVPLVPDRDLLKRMRGIPALFFPVATDGAGEIVQAYSLFVPAGPAPEHVEFLIDRSGYLRARVSTPPDQLPGLSALLTQIEALNQEPQDVPLAADHVH